MRSGGSAAWPGRPRPSGWLPAAIVPAGANDHGLPGPAPTGSAYRDRSSAAVPDSSLTGAIEVREVENVRQAVAAALAD